VPHPGELREGIARSSISTEVYPPSPFLEGMTHHYEEWLNREIEQCYKGNKSIILTAAQAYQRLVTIHPFENGNGRISRMMMDYALERFGLPPAVLGKNVLDAVYTLKPKQIGEVFVRKVFEGVKRSHEMVYNLRG